MNSTVKTKLISDETYIYESMGPFGLNLLLLKLKIKNTVTK